MSDLMMRAYARLYATLSREDGQAVTEYAVVLVLVAAVAALLMSTDIAGTLVTKITTQINSIGG
jgi:Flp pilus assembly pilin Flp